MEGAVGGAFDMSSILDPDLWAEISANKSLLDQIFPDELVNQLATEVIQANEIKTEPATEHQLDQSASEVKPFINDAFMGCEMPSFRDVKPVVPAYNGNEYHAWLLNRINALKKNIKDAEVIVIDSSDDDMDDDEHFKPNAHSTANDDKDA